MLITMKIEKLPSVAFKIPVKVTQDLKDDGVKSGFLA
jgi:hypothetical protein